MAARRRSRLKLLALVLALAFVSIELVLRLTGVVDVPHGHDGLPDITLNAANPFLAVDDAMLSYRNRPDMDVDVGGVPYRHDANGWRVMPRVADPGAPAVVFLGDSTTYGFGLDAADSLPARVAAELGGAIRPLNLGVCGYATGQERRLYATDRELLDDAPVLVLVLFPNDFVPTGYEWDSWQHTLYVDPLPLPRAVRRALWRSATYRALASWVALRQKVRGDHSAHRRSNVEQALFALDALAADVRADGRTLIVAHLPALERLDPYEFSKAIQHVQARCDALAVPFVDLLDGFLEQRERDTQEWVAATGQPPPGAREDYLSRYWLHDPGDHHYNPAGVVVAARALAPVIAEQLGDRLVR
jgi:lysophospholipase L1-like esterase